MKHKPRFYSEPECKQRRVVIARFVNGKRRGSWHLDPVEARLLADDLQSAADKVIDHISKNPEADK